MVRRGTEDHANTGHHRGDVTVCEIENGVARVRTDARSGRHRLGPSEVQHLDRAIRAHLDICRLEVGMDDALFVRRLECLGNLRRDPEAFAQRNRSAGDSLREIVTIDEFDDESGDTVALFESVDRRNMGMIQRREHLRFPLEAGEALGTVCHLGQQDLDRRLRPAATEPPCEQRQPVPGGQLAADPIRYCGRGGSHRQQPVPPYWQGLAKLGDLLRFRSFSNFAQANAHEPCEGAASVPFRRCITPRKFSRGVIVIVGYSFKPPDSVSSWARTARRIARFTTARFTTARLTARRFTAFFTTARFTTARLTARLFTAFLTTRLFTARFTARFFTARLATALFTAFFAKLSSLNHRGYDRVAGWRRRRKMLRTCSSVRKIF